MDEATLIVRREAIYDELMRHVVTNGRCDCGRFTERAPHYAPFARHLAAELAALHLNLAPAERKHTLACWDGIVDGNGQCICERNDATANP